MAPDLYKGRLTTEPDEANHLMTGLDFPAATHQDLRGAAQHLKTQSGKVAVMGFCMGGALTIAAAVHVPELAAVGYRETAFYDLQENTYLAVFALPSPPAGPTSPATIRPCSPGHPHPDPPPHPGEEMGGG